jgi:hypothetical protein
MLEHPLENPNAPKRRKPNARPAWLHKVRDYFHEPAVFSVLLPVTLVLCAIVYMRSAWTNFIFDEQEALLANPYVNGNTLGFWDVFSRDFWGLPATGTIGSYRPLPNMVWRLLWHIKEHAWLPHVFNLVVHAINGAMVGALVRRWLRSDRAAWLCAVTFVLSAVITEAVCGVVGIADVLGGTFVLLVLMAVPLSWYWLAPFTAASLFLGLLSKESTLTTAPVLPLVAFIVAPLVKPIRPQRWLKAGSIAVGVVVAVVAYTYFRRAFFHVKLPAIYDNALPATEPFAKQVLHDFLRWFKQPDLPKDPINNPLVDVEGAKRVAGALRVYFRGLSQVVFPWRLSGDYSFPQEPAPTKVLFPESILGGAFLILPPLVGVGCALRALWLEFRERWVVSSGTMVVDKGFVPSTSVRYLALLSVGLLWVPITYFPHSNIPILLPTVRAERFWYLPVIGTALLIGLFLHWLWERHGKKSAKWCWAVCVGFLGFQAIQGRMHALDYRNDLMFWESTARAVPLSAKAHLNYGVMLGARQRLDLRLVENKRAMELAPSWPMAHIYYADTLCRLHRPEEAWPHYVDGFKLGVNQQALIALALQCLWDEKAIPKHKDELSKLADQNKGSWLAYLATDIINNGEKYNGVDPQYRPRSYNGGPREKKTSDATSSTGSTQTASAQSATGTAATHGAMSAGAALAAKTTASASALASAKSTQVKTTTTAASPSATTTAR